MPSTSARKVVRPLSVVGGGVFSGTAVEVGAEGLDEHAAAVERNSPAIKPNATFFGPRNESKVTGKASGAGRNRKRTENR